MLFKLVLERNNMENLTPEEQQAIQILQKLMPYVLKKQAGFGKLNDHDLQILILHGLLSIAQTICIGLKIELPQYALLIQFAFEFLRRLIV
jgi:hypothetical protein